jgi:hypothetical protein
MPLKSIFNFAGMSWSEAAGDANGVGGWRIFKSITFSRGADWATTQRRN